jgi:hypothetical protein
MSGPHSFRAGYNALVIGEGMRAHVTEHHIDPEVAPNEHRDQYVERCLRFRPHNDDADDTDNYERPKGDTAIPSDVPKQLPPSLKVFWRHPETASPRGKYEDGDQKHASNQRSPFDGVHCHYSFGFFRAATSTRRVKSFR